MDVYAVGRIINKKNFFFTEKIIKLYPEDNDIYLFDDYKSADVYAKSKKISVFKGHLTMEEGAYLSRYRRYSDIGSSYPCYRVVNERFIQHIQRVNEDESEKNEKRRLVTQSL